MRWEYFSKRRGISLETFVDGAQTLEEALIIFKKGGVDHPLDNSLELLFKKSSKTPVVEPKKLKSPVSNITRAKGRKFVSNTKKAPDKKLKAASNAKRKADSD